MYDSPGHAYYRGSLLCYLIVAVVAAHHQMAQSHATMTTQMSSNAVSFTWSLHIIVVSLLCCLIAAVVVTHRLEAQSAENVALKQRAEGYRSEAGALEAKLAAIKAQRNKLLAAFEGLAGQSEAMFAVLGAVSCVGLSYHEACRQTSWKISALPQTMQQTATDMLRLTQRW